MHSRPLANHLTWGTYGTRLHGDPRCTVERKNNVYGEPVLDYDQHRWFRETGMLRFAPILFDAELMRIVESLVPAICTRGGWTLFESATGPDHVHVLLDTNDNDAKTVRRLLKRWLSEALSDRFPLPRGATWWAECGSIKFIFDQGYFDRALPYVRNQRATQEPGRPRSGPGRGRPGS